MTNRTPASQAANTNQLSDEYVNAVIQGHGYQSPETVIARLNQWIGLHGGEDSVTLLMYEAHKALSKLHADAVPNAQPAFWIDLEPINGSQNLLIRQWQNLGALGPGKHTLFLSPAAVQASAPVAGEAQPVCWIERTQLENVRDEGEDAWVYWRETGHAAEPDEVPLYAAPQASEAQRSCPSGDGSLRPPCETSEGIAS